MDRNRPVIPISVESDDVHVVVHRNGDIRDAVNIVLTDEDAARIRQGYVCCICLEVQDEPFPEKCWVCDFPMKDRQSEYVAKAYQGNVKMGPSTSYEQEMALMEEMEFQKKFEGASASPQITVPRLW